MSEMLPRLTYTHWGQQKTRETYLQLNVISRRLDADFFLIQPQILGEPLGENIPVTLELADQGELLVAAALG